MILKLKNKRLNSIKTIDINKIWLYKEVFLCKVFKYSWARQMLKRLDFYVYFSENECIKKILWQN